MDPIKGLPGSCGNKNGMFGKSNFSIWEEKYGTEKALEMWEQRNAKTKEKLKGRIPWNKGIKKSISVLE